MEILNTLLANPTLLIVLAVVVMTMFTGGGTATTELLLTLLRALKLIPGPDPQGSQQVYQGYMDKAWDALQSGKPETAKQLMQTAAEQAETMLSAESEIVPKGALDKLTEVLKSPLVLIVLAVVAMMIFGGGGCGL